MLSSNAVPLHFRSSGGAGVHNVTGQGGVKVGFKIHRFQNSISKFQNSQLPTSKFPKFTISKFKISHFQMSNFRISQFQNFQLQNFKIQKILNSKLFSTFKISNFTTSCVDLRGYRIPTRRGAAFGRTARPYVTAYFAKSYVTAHSGGGVGKNPWAGCAAAPILNFDLFEISRFHIEFLEIGNCEIAKL